MRARLLSLTAVAATCGLSTAAVAHHGTSITYDTSKTITVSGVVTEFVWGFPHTQIYFERKNDAGAVEKWGVEMGATPSMLKRLNAGWTRTSLKPGDQVTIICNPHKVPGATACLAKQISSGGKVLPMNPEQKAQAAAN